MKMKRPKEGWPWEQPGHRFSIDWPPGFVPSTAAKPGLMSDAAKRLASTQVREAARAEGKAWATGTIGALGPTKNHVRPIPFDTGRRPKKGAP